MQISLNEIKKIADLAMISLDESELVKYRENLENILNYVKILESVDTSAIELDQCNVLAKKIELHERLDESNIGIGRSGLINSIGYESGLIKVPRII